jgi:hypothetical protein
MYFYTVSAGTVAAASKGLYASVVVRQFLRIEANLLCQVPKLRCVYIICVLTCAACVLSGGHLEFRRCCIRDGYWSATMGMLEFEDTCCSHTVGQTVS